MSISRLRQTIKRHLPQPIKSMLVSIKYRGAALPGAEIYRSHLKGQSGIEIGGPSTVFATQLPVYQVIRRLDGVNFASSTIWEGSVQAGDTYRFHGWKKGRQHVADATNLSAIKSGSYDFLLSSNCLEHVANPLKAMDEWTRVVKRKGALLLVLPNKATNFDHHRPVTRFQHLLEDYHGNVGEDDLTHLEEILQLHDLSMDPPAGDRDSFRKRSQDNFNNRTLHHHVFDADLIHEIFEHVGLDMIAQQKTDTDFIALGMKRN
jgi:SAM-dependent methyltransferase